jgi:DNA-binding CsgD family transcriptional regulator
MNEIPPPLDPGKCRWCLHLLEECICYSPAWKHARAKLRLTERECTLMDAFSTLDGGTKHVARKLAISTKTVEELMARLKQKLGVSTRTACVLMWDRAIQEHARMADQIKPHHPLDIFEFPDGSWYYRVDLEGLKLAYDEAVLWPHNSPHWHQLCRQA